MAAAAAATMAATAAKTAVDAAVTAAAAKLRRWQQSSYTEQLQQWQIAALQLATAVAATRGAAAATAAASSYDSGRAFPQSSSRSIIVCGADVVFQFRPPIFHACIFLLSFFFYFFFPYMFECACLSLLG
jgi:hypothetical protein